MLPQLTPGPVATRDQQAATGTRSAQPRPSARGATSDRRLGLGLAQASMERAARKEGCFGAAETREPRPQWQTRGPDPLPMAQPPILPGATVVVRDRRSIYDGYRGFVQRLSGARAAVLFEGGNWDKLVTLPLASLDLA